MVKNGEVFGIPNCLIEEKSAGDREINEGFETKRCDGWHFWSCGSHSGALKCTVIYVHHR